MYLRVFFGNVNVFMFLFIKKFLEQPLWKKEKLILNHIFPHRFHHWDGLTPIYIILTTRSWHHIRVTTLACVKSSKIEKGTHFTHFDTHTHTHTHKKKPTSVGVKLCIYYFNITFIYYKKSFFTLFSLSSHLNNTNASQ